MLDSIKGAASKLLGGNQNNLQKANIVNVKTKESIPCQFNPEELSINRSVSWASIHTPFLNSPLMQFKGSSPTTCQMNLIFDTAEAGEDVRAYTNALIKLTLKGSGNAQKTDVFLGPPVVSFEWGKFQLFKAVITSLSISYTLFLSDGTPVRARANITFTQNDHEDDPLPPQNPTSRTEPRKTRIIQSGERLDMIAYQEYGHPRHWRKLAEANDIDHIDALRPGQMIVIPPLD
jgi:hypothetical protein